MKPISPYVFPRVKEQILSLRRFFNEKTRNEYKLAARIGRWRNRKIEKDSSRFPAGDFHYLRFAMRFRWVRCQWSDVSERCEG